MPTTVVPLNPDARADLRARVAVVRAVREALGERAADAVLTTLAAVSVAVEHQDEADPDHLVALVASTWDEFIEAAQR